MTTTTDLPAVKVRWVDAQGDAHGWTPADELDADPCVVTTVGQLLDTPRPGHTSVALSSYGGSGCEVRQVDSVVHIPDGMVLSVIYLHAH